MTNLESFNWMSLASLSPLSFVFSALSPWTWLEKKSILYVRYSANSKKEHGKGIKVEIHEDSTLLDAIREDVCSSHYLVKPPDERALETLSTGSHF